MKTKKLKKLKTRRMWAHRSHLSKPDAVAFMRRREYSDMVRVAVVPLDDMIGLNRAVAQALLDHHLRENGYATLPLSEASNPEWYTSRAGAMLQAIGILPKRRARK